MKYLAKQGDSLDALCYQHYGTLETAVYSEFLRENEHLLTLDELKGGEVVNFPDITPPAAQSVRYLWD